MEAPMPDHDHLEISDRKTKFCSCSASADPGACSRRQRARARRRRSRTSRVNRGPRGDPDDGPTIAVQITDTRVIAIRRRDQNSWTVFSGVKVYSVSTEVLLDPFKMDMACDLKLSTYNRGSYLRSLLAALNRARISVLLTKSLVLS
jgi:hypothetical protein